MQLAPIIHQALLAETEELDLAHAQVDDLLALASGLACGLGSPPGGEATHHIVENEVRAFRVRVVRMPGMPRGPVGGRPAGF